MPAAFASAYFMVETIRTSPVSWDWSAFVVVSVDCPPVSGAPNCWVSPPNCWVSPPYWP